MCYVLLYKSLCVKYLLFLSDFNESGASTHFQKKTPQISNFINIRPVGADLFHADRRTERYTIVYCKCNWVDTRWQQYSTHLHTNSTQNTENGTYITIKKLTVWEMRAVSRLYELYSGICLTAEEKARTNLS
jgi:hypothetical protein